jgi:hypothetical protein
MTLKHLCRGDRVQTLCMSNILTKATVLGLNRNWQAIKVRTLSWIGSVPNTVPNRVQPVVLV